MYQVIFSGDEAGLYQDGELVAGWWILWKSGYDVLRILHWRQSSLAKVAQKFK
jgi:hypothetical protein